MLSHYQYVCIRHINKTRELLPAGSFFVVKLMSFMLVYPADTHGEISVVSYMTPH